MGIFLEFLETINPSHLRKGILVALSFSIFILIFFYILNKKRVDEKIEKIFKKIFNKDKKRVVKVKEKEKTPSEELYKWSKGVKNFFKNYLRLEEDLTFTEIAKVLRSKKNRGEKKREKLAKFCEKLNYFLYAKESISREDVENLKKEFREIKRK